MKKLISAALILVASQYSVVGHAATTYTFQGSLDSYGDYTPPALQSLFSTYGINLNQPITFQIELDSSQQGRTTAADGTTTYLPFYASGGSLTYQQAFSYSATFLSWPFAGVPANYTAFPNNNYAQNYTYWSYNYDEGDYSASLVTGPSFIRKEGAYGDTDAFVESWTVGETFDWVLHYEDGYLNQPNAYDFWARGSVQLVSISGVPIPPTIPIPAAGWLFASSAIVLAATKRRRAA